MTLSIYYVIPILHKVPLILMVYILFKYEYYGESNIHTLQKTKTFTRKFKI